MKNHAYRIAELALAFVAILLFSACSPKQQAQDEVSVVPENAVSQEAPGLPDSEKNSSEEAVESALTEIEPTEQAVEGVQPSDLESDQEQNPVDDLAPAAAQAASDSNGTSTPKESANIDVKEVVALKAEDESQPEQDPLQDSIAEPTDQGVGDIAVQAEPSTDEPPPAAPAVLADGPIASGVWTKKSFKANGQWQIVREAGKVLVKLDESFSTRKAPDLKLFLSPRSADQVTAKNAVDGSVLIAPLASHKGAQVYELPVSAELDQYRSIIIHCEAYTKLWSAADL